MGFEWLRYASGREETQLAAPVCPHPVLAGGFCAENTNWEEKLLLRLDPS